MQSVFGDADAPIVVELAQKPDLQALREVGRVMDRGAAAVPRRLGAAGTGDRGHQQGRGLQRVLRLDPGSATRGVIAENDPAEQEKSVKWNSLLCNLIVFHIAIDMMEVIRQLVAEGWQVTAEDLAQLSPYLTSHILRFGAYATDELHIPPDVFDPALDEVDFGGEQPAAA